MKYYIHAHLPMRPGCFWASCDPKGGFCLGKEPLFMHAFEEREANDQIALMLVLFPGIEIILYECDSEKLIPENMRKVLRI